MKVYSAPQQVTLNVTNRCNLHCLYCAVSDTKNAPGDLSLAQWLAVIDELAEMRVFHLILSGGEPFIRTDFIHILRHILRQRFRISINTNGTCFDKDVLACLSQTKRLDNIQVSLDGHTPAIHDAIRGGGAFADTSTGIEMLRSKGLPFTFFVVVCRINIGHLSDIVQYARRIGARQVSFSEMLPLGNAKRHMKKLALNAAERLEAAAVLRELQRSYPDHVGGTFLQTIRWMDGFARLSDADLPQQAGRVTSCGGGVSEFSIRPDGKVIPCDRLWDFTVGNVRTARLRDIWQQSEGFRRFRRRYRMRVDDFKHCRSCRYTGVCRGGCPAIPHSSGDGILGWDSYSCYRVFAGEQFQSQESENAG